MPQITVDPASHDFGEVSVGSPPTTISITLRASADAKETQTVSLRPDSGPLSIVPPTVSVAPGESQTVTLRFEPTERTTSIASFTVGDTVVGTVRGTGIEKVAAAPETVEDIEDVTFYEVHLDNFATARFERPPDPDEPNLPESLTAFLRLGSFDLNRESKRSLELLNLIPQTGPATNPYGLTSNVKILERDGVEGTIFADDVRTRPQDVDRIGETDAVFGTNTQLLGVEDDPGNKLTIDQRHLESSRLYSRGGWRDHSDGNRVSTTYGDKVEVIRGNYKLVVMGRQDNIDEAIGWEGSGSHVQDYAPGTMPGASFWLEWINDPRYYAPEFGPDGSVDPLVTSQKGVWLLVNTTENVYEYARYAGNFREERWGDVLETYIGSENPPERGAFALDDVTGTLGHEPPVRLGDRNYDLPQKAGSDNAERNVPLFTDDNKGQVRSNPHIIEKTWAKRIDSFTGTDRCRVEAISENRFADRYDEEIRVTGKYKTDFRAKVFEEKFVATDHIDEFRKAATINTQMIAGNVFDLFVANYNEVFAGATQSIKLGGFIDITLGAMEWNLDIVLQRTQIEIAYSSIAIDMARVKNEIESFHVKKNKLDLSPIATDIRAGSRTIVNFLGETKAELGIAMEASLGGKFMY
ncbi:MAG: hypothetical protein AAGA56_13860 [Myxococcota bacterium]